MPEIDALLQRLREAAADHVPANLPTNVTIRAWPGGSAQNTLQSPLSGIALHPRPGLALLLLTNTTDFINLAYQACLGRHPDPGGLQHYTYVLESGVTRLEVLGSLWFSPEGRRNRGNHSWWVLFHPLFLLASSKRWLAQRIGRLALKKTERLLSKLAKRTSLSLMLRIQESTADQMRLLQKEIDENKQAIGNLFAQTQRANQSDELSRYYLDFESTFRGIEEDIGNTLETDYLAYYLALREDQAQSICLDLGCGRGEWLDNLRTNGFTAKGVDANPVMVGHCRDKGHDVEHTDALIYLRTLQDESVSAISCLHLVEHLEFATLFELILQCNRVLRRGGVLIIETPNPENLWVSTHTFYHDPTHRNPMTPESLAHLVSYHGLQVTATLRLHPYPSTARLPGSDPVTERLNGMTCCGQDFSIVAHKAP